MASVRRDGDHQGGNAKGEKKVVPAGHAETCAMGNVELDPESCVFYRSALEVMQEAGIPFLVAGAFAFQRYTGISRHTKDFDIVLRPQDVGRALAAFQERGYQTEVTSQVWIAKVFQGELFVDLIFRSGNGVCEVDDSWFDHAVEGQVLGARVKLCAPEEMVWSKAYVMNRDRYDGADVAHLILACAPNLDWTRLLRRFASHWRVLLSHLILFGFIYPSERNLVPGWLMDELLVRLEQERTLLPPEERITYGPLFSRTQYLVDTEQWGYVDGRVQPPGNLTQEEVEELDRQGREEESKRK